VQFEPRFANGAVTLANQTVAIPDNVRHWRLGNAVVNSLIGSKGRASVSNLRVGLANNATRQLAGENFRDYAARQSVPVYT
jgi:hypothetical protein